MHEIEKSIAVILSYAVKHLEIAQLLYSTAIKRNMISPANKKAIDKKHIKRHFLEREVNTNSTTTQYLAILINLTSNR
jgi:hypothetical protein